MTGANSKEFAANQEKYFELTLNERGKYYFCINMLIK